MAYHPNRRRLHPACLPAYLPRPTSCENSDTQQRNGAKQVETAICMFAEKVVLLGRPRDATRLLRLSSALSCKVGSLGLLPMIQPDSDYLLCLNPFTSAPAFLGENYLESVWDGICRSKRVFEARLRCEDDQIPDRLVSLAVAIVIVQCCALFFR